MKMLVLLFACLIHLAAWSQEHAFLTPIGAYEGIAANTGIARDGSVGAVIYNPGGLASIQSTKLSASGSAFSQNQISEKSSEGTDSVKYFQSVPAQITTVFTNDNFNWAFSILVPKASKYDQKSKYNNNLEVNSTVEDQETHFGPSIGFALSDSLQFGASFFVANRNYRLSQMANLEEGAGSVTQARKLDVSGMSAYPILGLLFSPSEDFSLGIRFSAPTMSLKGTLEDSLYQTDSTGNSYGDFKDEKKGTTTFHKPMELGVGLSFHTTEQLKVLLDVTRQFKKSYQVYKEDAYGENLEFDYKDTQRYNLAFEYQTSQSDVLTLGFMYNSDPVEDSDLDFIGATVGYRSIDDIADSSFGLFFNKASDKQDDYKTEQLMVGLFIASSINFSH